MHSSRRWLLVALVSFSLGFGLNAKASDCRADAVPVGGVCVDKYEISVWTIVEGTPHRDRRLLRLTRLAERGRLTPARLRSLGAVQVGLRESPSYPGCTTDGSSCEDYFAASLEGTLPSAFLSPAQAMAICASSGKRLTSNAVWQQAVLGTPYPENLFLPNECNFGLEGSAEQAAPTGSFEACQSTVGAWDMLGNLTEWVTPWIDEGTCLTGGEPPPLCATTRGGGFSDFQEASTKGVYAFTVPNYPSVGSPEQGARCMR